MNLIGLRRFVLGSLDLLILVGIVVPLLLGIRLKLHALPMLIAVEQLPFGSALSLGLYRSCPQYYLRYI